MLIIEKTRVGPTDSYFIGGGIGSIWPWERKTFGGYNRTWVFYSDGANIVYKSSPDKVTWDITANIVPNSPATQGTQFALWFDGIYVHLVYDSSIDYIYYRRGLPDINGIISWNPAKIVAPKGFKRVTIALDSYGFPYITYNSNEGRLFLVKSSLIRDWETEFEIEITNEPELLANGLLRNYPTTSTAQGFWQASVYPLTGGRMYIIFTLELNPTWGKVYDPITGFSPIEVITTHLTSESGVWCGATAGDTVYLALNSNRKIELYKKSNSVWEYTLLDTLGTYNIGMVAPAICIHNQTPVVFWATQAGDGELRCAYFTDTSLIVQTLFADDFAIGWNFNAFSDSYSGIAGLIYSAPEWGSRSIYFTGIDFEQEPPPPPIEYSVNIGINGNGNTTPAPGIYTIEENSQLEIQAIPATDWEFTGWTGDINSPEQIINIIVNSNMNIQANFVEVTPPPPNQVQLILQTTIGGTTTPPPGNYAFDEATQVTLIAQPESGWKFISWSGTFIGTNNPLTIIMDEDANITANFEQESEPPPPPPISNNNILLFGGLALLLLIITKKK
jgi:hypothetical protein